MELWTIDNFKNPKFLPEIKTTVEGAFELDDGYISYDIELEGNDNIELMKLLEQSKLDNSSMEQIMSMPLTKEQQAFLAELEQLGMVGEFVDAEQDLLAKNSAITQHIQEAVDAYHGAKNAQKALPQVKQALTQLNQLLDGQHINVDQDILTDENFFTRILAMQFLAWKHLCPPALNAAQNTLEIILGLSDEIRPVRLSLFPTKEVRRCLLAVMWALTRSADDDAAVRLRKLPEITSADHAVNLGILAEKHALHSLEQLGQSKFLTGIRDKDTQGILARAGYAQEYYITDRFIDLIAPGISKRLPRKLKKLLRRYFNEEVGHEAFELKTCIALGMKKQVMLDSMPSPFGQVTCDIFSWLAHDEPLAYFSTISITEGLPGQTNPINEAVLHSDLLSDIEKFGSKQHEDLNFKLFHQLLPRWFLSECGVIDAQEQIRTMKFYNTMLEVSFRAWEELYRFHVEMAVPLNPSTMVAYVK